MHVHLPKPLHGWREFVGEVGIIVLGVLIALGAEQALESMHDRHQRHERLERLFEEARSNVTQLRSERELTRAMTQRESDFATGLSAGSCPPEDQWRAVATVTMYPAVTPNSSVYDEVVGAGGLASIDSIAARKTVADYHGELSWVQSQTDFFREHSSLPLAIDDPRLAVSFDPKAHEPEIMTFKRDELCNDRGFRNRIADHVRDHATIYNYRADLTEAAIRMCASIGYLIGRSCDPTDGHPLAGADLKVAQEAIERARKEG